MQQENEIKISEVIGARIEALLEKRSMTQYELARKADVGYHTVHNAIHGKTKLRPSILGRIAVALGVTVEYLRNGADRPTQSSKPTSGSQVREAAESYSAGGEMSVQKAIKFISEQVGMPEHLFWDCFKKVVEERGREGSGKSVHGARAG